MPVIAIGLFFLTLLLNLANDNRVDGSIRSEADLSRLVAEQMIVVRNSASLYAESHKGTSRAVPANQLDIDPSVLLDPCIQAYISAGKAYVYCTLGPSGLHGELIEQTDKSFFVGVNSKGVLRNAATGVTGVTLPKAVPDGVVVYAQ